MNTLDFAVNLFHGETFYGLTAPLGSSGVFASSRETNAVSSTTQMTADSRRLVVTLTNWTFALQFNRVFTSVFSTKHFVLNMPLGMHVLTLLSPEARICHTPIEAYLWSRTSPGPRSLSIGALQLRHQDFAATLDSSLDFPMQCVALTGFLDSSNVCSVDWVFAWQLCTSTIWPSRTFKATRVQAKNSAHIWLLF